ncbi:MAG: hypothetical protein ACRD3E_12305 [Terriglobales bacterium]
MKRIRWAWLFAISATLLSAAAAQNAQPGDPTVRNAVRAKGSDASLWVSFVPVPKGARVRSIAGQGTLELGRMSYLNGASEEGVSIHRAARTFTVSTRFGLLVGDPSMHGTAKLVAVLTQIEPAILVTVDGVNLSSSAEVIQMAIKYGVVTEHQLEIEIPTSMSGAAAQVANSIAFQVFAN